VLIVGVLAVAVQKLEAESEKLGAAIPRHESAALEMGQTLKKQEQVET
jgi:hypothetical protein